MAAPTVLVAAVVVWDEQGRVLTVRKRGTRRFMLPGGKPEPGEALRATAARELAEETGLAVLAAGLDDWGMHESAAANEPGHTVRAQVFAWPGPVASAAAAAEIEEARWLDPRLPSGDLAPLLVDLLPRIADGAEGATRPTLTLFCGLPGAGKSTLARRLEGEGRGVRLATDEWQHAIGIAPEDTAAHERLQRVLYGHALELLVRGVDVILEDGLWTAVERAEKLADARRAGARVELHVLDLPVEVLWQRLERRNAAARAGDYPMTRAELDWAAGVFERPTRDELALADEVRHHGEDA